MARADDKKNGRESERFLGGGTFVQGLVYLFIAVCGAALGLAAYLGLTFSPIQAGLLALLVVLAGCVYVERRQRLRAEARLEKAIDDLSRLLSTDAQAGQVLSKRINAISDLDLGPRLDVIEADISVLGTVIRQVAEAVSDLEAGHADARPDPRSAPQPVRAAEPAAPRRPVIPPDQVRRALDADGLIHHMLPMVTLPQRKTHGYDLVPRLLLEDGALADAEDFVPERGSDDALRARIFEAGLRQAVTVVRRARMGQEPIRLFVPIDAVLLSNRAVLDRLDGEMAAHGAVLPDICFVIADADWQRLGARERAEMSRLLEGGTRLALADVASLRLDFADLAARGLRQVRLDAARFIEEPTVFTDFHSADIADYVKRFGIELAMTGVTSEEQILSLLDDGIGLAQGPAIARPGPLRPDLRDEPAAVDRVASRV